MNDIYEMQTTAMKQLQTIHSGYVIYESKNIVAELRIDENSSLIKIGELIDLDIEELNLFFVFDDNKKLHISTNIIAHRNSIQLMNKTISRYSEGKVYSFSTENWSNSESIFRSYFLTSNRLLYDFFGAINKIDLKVNNYSITVRHCDNYLVFETTSPIKYENYTEIRYNTLVALGFVSGKFIQDNVFTFQQASNEENGIWEYKYEKLRRGHNSIYHALTFNPFGYEYMIGKAVADRLYKDNTLSPLKIETFSRLIELSLNNNQIQYALVLFNEANSNELSLLVKNNCFFAILEVLRKFFYDAYKGAIPSDYSQKSNLDKSIIAFKQICEVTEDEKRLLSHRNVFMHGDIKDMEGDEMVEIMQKQITFIYKLMLTYVGFNGYIIDHYSIRNTPTLQSFIKLRPGLNAENNLSS